MPTAALMTVGIGAVVGVLVGLTGVGGGVVLLPLLILGLGVTPLTAVGSGALFSSCTKLGAAAVHARQRTVDWALVRRLAFGSVPAAFAGVALLAHLQTIYGAGVNTILERVIAVVLIVIPVLIAAESLIGRGRDLPLLRPLVPRWVGRTSGAVVTGVLGGFLVGITSVGSGIVVMMLLLLFFNRRPAVLVGTDIAHAVLLTAVTAALHARLGTIDLHLVLWLLVGSVPGALLGSRLSLRLPRTWLRVALIILLFVTGWGMLGP